MRSKRKCAMEHRVLSATRTKRQCFSWDTKIQALYIFKKIFGHLNVPLVFVVPHESPWPDEFHGMKLGAIVSNIRDQCDDIALSRITELDDMGFLWSPTSILPWSTKISALKSFKRLHGHIRVPDQFEIPDNDSRWDSSLWGIKLGNIVSGLRIRGIASLTQTRRNDLATLGFVWSLRSNPNQFKMSDWGLNITALSIYKQIFGHLRVPGSFVIPALEPWPEKLHGTKLGQIVAAMRAGNLLSVQREQLRQLGFLWDGSDKHVWELVLSGMKKYHQIHNSHDIPKDYCVPTSIEWHTDMWFLPLGALWQEISLKLAQCPNKLATLYSAGIYYEPPISHTLLIEYLRLFYDEYGHINIPTSYKIPMEEPWPPKSHGIDLGVQIQHLRNHPTMDLQEELADLGFKWSMNDWDIDEIELAIDTYEMICGHRNIGPSFIVPEGLLEWPMHLWNMPLGKLVKMPTVLTKERIWARGLAYFKDIYGHMYVPPSYAIPTLDIRFPVQLWGYKLGQLVLHIKTGRVLLNHEMVQWLIEHEFDFDTTNLIN
ncbi:hypothetical protein THRCLA_11972 [Thraustotheca clavata]|uniref:Helicase-associated domain-containing protein n=1 Tax=Thraustotheca clavata TaxID=74557 RepID=A0A1V9Y4G8_9STRA|nr:hypothetical protein THRCLA_11972 [Thraustotheca clavata]